MWRSEAVVGTRSTPASSGGEGARIRQRRNDTDKEMDIETARLAYTNFVERAGVARRYS